MDEDRNHKGSKTQRVTKVHKGAEPLDKETPSQGLNGYASTSVPICAICEKQKNNNLPETNPQSRLICVICEK